MNTQLLGLLYVIGACFAAWRMWAIYKKGEIELLVTRLHRKAQPRMFLLFLAPMCVVIGWALFWSIPALIGWNWWETLN